MKPIKTLLTILFISLLSSPSWSMTLGDLVERDGLYYEKFTDVPYTGEVTGQEQGSIKHGERDGLWVWYYVNGQLRQKMNFKNGYKDGAYVAYHENGQLFAKGNFKNDEEEGDWVLLKEDGTVDKEWTGTYKDVEKISE